MQKRFSRFFGALLTFGVLLTACVFPEQEDPFERLPEEPLEVIDGRLFPFSVSVSTRATHRLEKEGKLVAYLTSDIVQLSEFENREVELDGVWRNEKMRQIFWVEAIRVTDIAEEETGEKNPIVRFTTKKFTFQHPGEWESTLSPDGVAYFVNKNDPSRRVFFTLKVEDYSPEAIQIKPNILMNGFAGIKEVDNETSGKEKEVVTLFSNLGNKKYVFEINHNFDDFDTKKQFLDVLNSFVEGEEQVQKVIADEQKALAEAEAAKLAEEEAAAEAIEEVVEETEEAEVSFLDKLLGKDGETSEKQKTEEPIETEVKEVAVVEEPAETIIETGEYTNLIDERAFYYENKTYNFSLSVPFGLWYRHYGPGYANVTEMGFADEPLNSRDDVKFWMRIINKEKPPEEIDEIAVAGQVTVIKKRDESSVFEFNGPIQFRDQMRSMAEVIR